MSTNVTTSHSDSDSDATESPTLGPRYDFWGDSDDDAEGDDDETAGGHDEAAGTDPAEYVAHQLALRVVDPICGKTGRPLSEPRLYVPKQVSVGQGATIQYRQHRHRRRVEPKSGRINWGETTSTDIPPFAYDIYRLCVHTYLAERDGLRLTEVDDYLKYAERVWRDEQYGSKDALEQFIRHVREEEEGET